MSKWKQKKRNKRKKQQKPRGQRKQTSLQSQIDSGVVQVFEYEITSEPLENPRFNRLPAHVQDAIERLYYEIQEQPGNAIPEILDLIEKYPNIPTLYNYLSVAYSAVGKFVQAEEIVMENYRRNPDYLFARINYAKLYLDRGNYDEVANIFEHKFDLKQLYPHRKKFHVTEVVNFMSLIGIYFVETGDRESAEMYLEIVEQLELDIPIVKLFRQKMYPGYLSRMLDSPVNRKQSNLPRQIR